MTSRETEVFVLQVQVEADVVLGSGYYVQTCCTVTSFFAVLVNICVHSARIAAAQILKGCTVFQNIAAFLSLDS